MKNKVQLRKLVKGLLNDNVTDPYPKGLTRPGNHFYDESDNINLSRGQTFPKGLIKINNSPATIKQNQGKTGHATKFCSIGIYYYVKEKQSYTEDSIIYKNEDLVYFMLDKIEQTLLDNQTGSDYHLSPNSITESTDLPKLREGSFSLYVGYRTVTYYWDQTYGI